MIPSVYSLGFSHPDLHSIASNARHVFSPQGADLPLQSSLCLGCSLAPHLSGSLHTFPCSEAFLDQVVCAPLPSPILLESLGYFIFFIAVAAVQYCLFVVSCLPPLLEGKLLDCIALSSPMFHTAFPVLGHSRYLINICVIDKFLRG